MRNQTQNKTQNGVVVVEPVILRPGHSFIDLREAMSLFSQTLKKHNIASGYLGCFVVLENQSATEEEVTAEESVLLTFFWHSRQTLNQSNDNPLYQVLLDDVLSHCQSPEGVDLRAPGLVTQTFEPAQVSGLKRPRNGSNGSTTH